MKHVRLKLLEQWNCFYFSHIKYGKVLVSPPTNQKKMFKNFNVFGHLGAEALTSDDLKFGQSCFGAFWSISFLRNE
jgi:hypothetical protein